MSFIEACINDTNSVDLSFNGSNELEADLRLGSENTLETVVSGVQVRFAGSSGLGTDSNGLIVDTQLPGLARDANGAAKVMTAAGAGWGPGSADDTVAHNFPIARGSSTAIYQLNQTGSVAQSIATRVILFAYASFRIRTTWIGLGDPATNINDEVGLQLQSNVDNAGWVTMARFELVGHNQRTTANLSANRYLTWEDGTSHSVSTRAIVTGGITTGTAVQGTLERSFYKGQVLYY